MFDKSQDPDFVGSLLEKTNILNQLQSQDNTPPLRSNMLKIACNTAFGPNTPVYVNKRIINMTQMSIAYPDKVMNTIGIEPDTWLMKECKIAAVPEKIYIPYTITMVLEDGFNIECGPDSLVLTNDGYRKVDSLEKGKTVQVTKHNIETHNVFVEDIKIVNIDKSRAIVQVQTPVYLIISEYANIFIPYILPNNNTIVNMINFKQ